MIPDLSVVIVNYNTGNDLNRCIASLAVGIGEIEWDGVIIDNASTDDSGKHILGLGKFILHHNLNNVGFSRAVNQGIAMSKGRYVLILNPDCELMPGVVMVLLDELNRDSANMLVGPRILDPDGAIQGSARGDPTMFTGLFGRTGIFTKMFPQSRIAKKNVQTLKTKSSKDSSVSVDWVSGACMLARRDTLVQVGCFDERFFLYWEDADLCRRLRENGGAIRYVPVATVKHRVGRSSETAKVLAIKSFHASAYLYYTTYVAQSLFNPARWVAKVILYLRCQWQLVRYVR